MGVTLEVFQSFGSFDCSRDLLKMEVIAGVMALAVAWSIWHETPSGPELSCVRFVGGKVFIHFLLGTGNTCQAWTGLGRRIRKTKLRAGSKTRREKLIEKVSFLK